MGKGKGMLFGKPKSQVVKHPGAFREKADRLGITTTQLASKVLKPGSKASAQTKKQAVLAKTFSKMRKKK